MKICTKSFVDLAALSKHKKSAVHLRRINIDQNEDTGDEINIKKFKLKVKGVIDSGKAAINFFDEIKMISRKS